MPIFRRPAQYSRAATLEFLRQLKESSSSFSVKVILDTDNVSFLPGVEVV